MGSVTGLVGTNMSLQVVVVVGKGIYERSLMHQASSLSGPKIRKTVHKDFEPGHMAGHSHHSGMA